MVICHHPLSFGRQGSFHEPTDSGYLGIRNPTCGDTKVKKVERKAALRSQAARSIPFFRNRFPSLQGGHFHSRQILSSSDTKSASAPISARSTRRQADPGRSV